MPIQSSESTSRTVEPYEPQWTSMNRKASQNHDKCRRKFISEIDDSKLKI